MTTVRKKKVGKSVLTLGEVRTITKAFSQLLVITIAKEPEKVKKLLRLYGYPISKNAADQELISALIELVSEQSQAFNNDLALLIEMTLPDHPQQEQYDNFGEKIFQFGGSAGLGNTPIIGGGIGGSSVESGAKTIGTGAATGAAGGGLLGGIIGAVGGIFNHSATVKQQKIEKDKAASKVFSDLLQFRRGGANANSNNGTYLAVGITMLVLIGIILIVARNQGKNATT